jgi:hypothetical protein
MRTGVPTAAILRMEVGRAVQHAAIVPINVREGPFAAFPEIPAMTAMLARRMTRVVLGAVPVRQSSAIVHPENVTRAAERVMVGTAITTSFLQALPVMVAIATGMGTVFPIPPPPLPLGVVMVRAIAPPHPNAIKRRASIMSAAPLRPEAPALPLQPTIAITIPAREDRAPREARR